MTKRKQQQIDAMTKRLKDIAYPTIGDEWGGDCCVITAGDIGKVINDVRHRLNVEAEENSDIWCLFKYVNWLHHWEDPAFIAERLVDHGVKP